MGRTRSYLSRPGFVVDEHSITREPGRQIDWGYVTDAYRDNALKAKLNGAASSTDTSLTVDALPAALTVGMLLYFGQSGEYARVTAPAALGATTVSVESLPANLEDDDEAVIPGSGDAKTIKAGTVMCELSSGKVVPRAIRPASETSIGLLASDAVENSKEAALSGYGIIVGGVIYENLLPDADGGTPSVISSTYKTELQTAGVGTGFSFRQYADNRAA